MRAISTLLILLLCAAIGSAQNEAVITELARGHGLHSVSPRAGMLVVQGREKVSLLAASGWKPQVVAETPLPEDAFAWDHHPAGILIQTSHGLLDRTWGEPGKDPVEVVRIAGKSALFRGDSSTVPELRRFVVGVEFTTDEVQLVLPEPGALLVGSLTKTDEMRRIPAVVPSEQSLGWGLGYRMTARLTVPFFSRAETDGDDGEELLYRDGDHFRSVSLDHESGEEPRAWGKAPASESTEVVRFDMRVPPLCRDFDGDGLSDLVHLDPGGGYVFVYRGRDRGLDGKAREPDQIINVSGHVLWSWLVDTNGDGKDDLVTLDLDRLNIIAQVNVMRERNLPVNLVCRRQREDGSFSRSVSWVLSLDLPCELSLTRNLRRARFRAPIVLLPAVEGKARVLGAKDGEVRIFEQTESGFDAIANLDGLLLEHGHYAEPFAPPRINLDGGGPEELILLARDIDGDLDRLLAVTLP